MTTIAIDATGLVAADTQLTSANYVLHAQKLFRMPDGGVISGCGEWALVYARIQWELTDGSGDPPDLRSSEIVIVKPDKSIWVGERDCPVYPILDTTIAIGCGRDLARSALARGMTALEAVQEAVQLDHFTGEPLQTMQVVTLAELPGAVSYATKSKRNR
jgi:hypothetical protein